MSFFQWFLPAFAVIYFAQVFVIRSYVQWKRTGDSPFVFGKSGNAHDYIGLIFKLMSLATLCSIILFSFVSAGYQYLVPISYLGIDELQYAGVILCLISFIWIIIAQSQMDNSWRIGIDYEEKTELVQTGIFSISRNPVFLGVLLIYLGFFLIIPNALTCTLFVLCYFLLNIQARLEEDYLVGKHGQDYLNYKKSVRRWI